MRGYFNKNELVDELTNYISCMDELRPLIVEKHKELYLNLCFSHMEEIVDAINTTDNQSLETVEDKLSHIDTGEYATLVTSWKLHHNFSDALDMGDIIICEIKYNADDVFNQREYLRYKINELTILKDKHEKAKNLLNKIPKMRSLETIDISSAEMKFLAYLSEYVEQKNMEYDIL